jgi:hypothetical protein
MNNPRLSPGYHENYPSHVASFDPGTLMRGFHGLGTPPEVE